MRELITIDEGTGLACCSRISVRCRNLLVKMSLSETRSYTTKDSLYVITLLDYCLQN
jgi:hypothetical protein